MKSGQSEKKRVTLCGRKPAVWERCFDICLSLAFVLCLALVTPSVFPIPPIPAAAAAQDGTGRIAVPAGADAAGPVGGGIPGSDSAAPGGGGALAPDANPPGQAGRVGPVGQTAQTGQTAGAAAPDAPVAAGKEEVKASVYTEEQAFRGALRRDVSLLLAKAKARYRAMTDAARYLAGRQDVRVAASQVLTTQALDPLGLAYAIYDVKMLPAELSGFSTELMVRASLALTPRYSAPGQDPVEYSVSRALKNLEVVNLYSKSVKQENKLLKEIIAMADQVMREPPKSKARELELSVRFAQLSDKLIAIEKFRNILPQLEDGIWTEPEKALESMRHALEFDSQNPLVLDALGENLLILGNAREAVEYLTTAIRLSPDNARTYHTRGAAYLSLHLPALAIDDFSAALRLRPNTAAYLEARGAARLLHREFKEMCEDFYAACALGECKNYQWALERGYCRPASADNPTAAQAPVTAQ